MQTANKTNRMLIEAQHGGYIGIYTSPTTGRLNCKTLCILSYKATAGGGGWLEINIAESNYSQQVIKHYRAGLLKLFKTPALYDKALAMYKMVKQHDKTLRTLDRQRRDGGLCDYEYLTTLFLQQNKLGESGGGWISQFAVAKIKP